MKLKLLLSCVGVVLAGLGQFSVKSQAGELICEGKHLTVIGDSLVAGYGLAPGEGFPEQLQKALLDKGYKIELSNAGVSGDTSSAGLARLDWSLSDDTSAVVLEFGANDALRGISPDLTRKNIDAMIVNLKTRNIDIIVAGMLAPPNMGEKYGVEFNAIYPELAEKHGVALYPFFLDGVAGTPELNQSDGIHPTSEGIKVMVENFLPTAIEQMQRVCEN